jgi:hypothetical protein
MRCSRHLTWENSPVELRGFEPLTFCMPCSLVSSDDVALRPVTAVQSRFDVWGRLARSGGVCVRWDWVWYWFTGTSTSKEVRPPSSSSRSPGWSCTHRGRPVAGGPPAHRGWPFRGAGAGTGKPGIAVGVRTAGPDGHGRHATATGPAEPWRVLLLPQPEQICLMYRIDTFGVHQIVLYRFDEALGQLVPPIAARSASLATSWPSTMVLLSQFVPPRRVGPR